MSTEDTDKKKKLSRPDEPETLRTKTVKILKET